MDHEINQDKTKWCAYCGKNTDHQSGNCLQLLRDREAVLNSEVIRLTEERKRLLHVALELVWELQQLCQKDIHKEQERELVAMQYEGGSK